MHWADINAAIYKAGSSPSQIAAQEKTTTSHVARIVRGSESSYRIATAISAVTNIPLNRLWPGRYNQPPRQARARSAA